jgi:hypothetical protein
MRPGVCAPLPVAHETTLQAERPTVYSGLRVRGAMKCNQREMLMVVRMDWTNPVACHVMTECRGWAERVRDGPIDECRGFLG